MEMDLGELGAVGRASVSVAVVGVVVRWPAGFGVSRAVRLRRERRPCSSAPRSAATSVGITARVFSDLRALATVEARTVLGAAVADDVLGLVILTVVVRIVSEGSVSVLSVLGIFAVALAVPRARPRASARGLRPPLFQFLDRYARSAGTLVALALAFTLGVRRARRRRGAGADRRGVRRRAVAVAAAPASERIPASSRPSVTCSSRCSSSQIGIDGDVEAFVRSEVLAIGGGAARRRNRRQARRRRRRDRIAGRQAAHRARA